MNHLLSIDQYNYDMLHSLFENVAREEYGFIETSYYKKGQIATLFYEP